MSEKLKTKVLVFRLSAIGDVAMTIPVLWSLSKTYPDLEITFVSQKFAGNFIKYLPNVSFFEVDLKNRHKGLWGIIQLYFDLRKIGKWDMVADLHDVIRTKILRLFFNLTFTKVKVIDKGRADKRSLCRIDNKQLRQLETTIDRYARVFKKLGFTFINDFDYLFTKATITENIAKITSPKDQRWIGVAPFAKHKGKIYPIDQMEVVIEKLSSSNNYKIFLFGGGNAEQTKLEEWETKFRNTISLAGKLSLEDEIKVISNLDVLISMDSANMHLASLVNTPVVSIWGATHPYAGFYGWNQNISYALQINLPCRPCSIYGNKPCFRKDYACLNLITPNDILNKVNEVIIA